MLLPQLFITKRNTLTILAFCWFFYLPVTAQVTCNNEFINFDQFLTNPAYLLNGVLHIDSLNLVNPYAKIANNSYCQITWKSENKLYQSYYQAFANTTSFRQYITQNGKPYFYRGTLKGSNYIVGFAVFDDLNWNNCVLQNSTLYYTPILAVYEVPTIINPSFTLNVIPPTNCNCRNFNTSATVSAFGANYTDVNNFIAQTGTDCVFTGFL